MMNRRKAIRNTGLFFGAAVASPSLIVLLNACQSEPRLDWKPQFFTIDEANFISTLVDMILPRTATPGALDVNVDVFLDRIFAQTYDEAGQKKVRADIAQFNADCKNSHGAVFAELNEEARIAVLTNAEKNCWSIWSWGLGQRR